MTLHFRRKSLILACGIGSIALPVPLGPLLRRGFGRSRHRRPDTKRLLSSRRSPAIRGATEWNFSGRPLRLTNMPLLPVLGTAYNIPWQSIESIRLRIRGMPDWILTEPSDVEATAEKAPAPGATAKARNERVRLMLQSVLADRLKLRVRRDIAEMPVYALALATHGPSWRRPKPPSGTAQRALHSAPPPLPGPAATSSRVVVGAGFVGLRSICRTSRYTSRTGAIAPFSIRPVSRDCTRIQTEGWASSGDDPSRPTLDEVFDRLGLKLVSKKAPVEILVIEHVERPSEN